MQEDLIIQQDIQPVSQTSPQTNISQPVVNSNEPKPISQPAVENSQYLQNKLRCPKIWCWISFAIHLIISISCIIYFLEENYVFGMVVVAIPCVISLLIAYLVNKSIATGNVERYKLALYISTGTIIVITSFLTAVEIIVIYLFSDFGYGFAIQLLIIFLSIIGFESITLCSLCYYKKEFDILTMPSNRQSTVPQ